MLIARHHAEWLSLIEASGPFLSLQTLLEVFPQGLDAHDPERFRVLRQAYEEWLENHSDVGIHRTWGEWVLKEIQMVIGNNLIKILWVDFIFLKKILLMRTRIEIFFLN